MKHKQHLAKKSHFCCCLVIAAFQAIDLGSIPGQCNFSFFFMNVSTYLRNNFNNVILYHPSLSKPAATFENSA